jgi:hypothetical protein
VIFIDLMTVCNAVCSVTLLRTGLLGIDYLALRCHHMRAEKQMHLPHHLHKEQKHGERNARHKRAGYLMLWGVAFNLRPTFKDFAELIGRQKSFSQQTLPTLQIVRTVNDFAAQLKHPGKIVLLERLNKLCVMAGPQLAQSFVFLRVIPGHRPSPRIAPPRA